MDTDKGTGTGTAADFLGLAGKTFLVLGVANKKSVAAHIAKGILDAGGAVVLSVQGDEQETQARRLFPGAPAVRCDLSREAEIAALAEALRPHAPLAGIVHSVAFANYSNGFGTFHETVRADFLQAMDISCFSLVSVANACRDLLSPDASVITISISTTRMAAENYGYMAPVKAALDSAVAFLAKSFSDFSRVRFNAVCAGLLKTSASAGIPGYLDSYLFAEAATLRKEGLATREVADVGLFLLSPRSSGINAQRIVVDAGMEINYFDKGIVKKVVGSE